MANIHKYEENVRVRYGGLSTALGGETDDQLATNEYVNMANYDLVVVNAVASGVASDSVITLKMYEATATNGAGSASLTHSLASDTFTATATNDLGSLTVQVRGEELSSGFQYVGAIISTSNASGTEKVGMIINQMRARYKQATLPA